MKPMKIPRIVTFRAMPLEDKLFVILLALVAIALFGYGLYMVGLSGLYLLGGAIVLVFITEIVRKVEIENHHGCS